ncbi:hypothetical protein C0W42_19685 [Photobacterium kishitanii]|nr:hypothetical protein C0W42_19685 [Photobacterium kishitanii]
MNQPNFEYVAPRKLTLKERIHKQRMENYAANERSYEYAMREYGDAGKAVVCDDEMDKKWLVMPLGLGRLTFSSEGNDMDGSLYFTRKPHLPNNNGVVIGVSGITFGRGLDIGSRTANDVDKLFSKIERNSKPISKTLLTWLKGGAGLKGQDAYEHYKKLNDSVPQAEQMLTRKQQYFLFLEIYPYYSKETKRLLTKKDVKDIYDKDNIIVWDDIPINIKELLIDITYRGDNSPRTRKIIMPALVSDMRNNKPFDKSSELYKVIANPIWVSKYGLDYNRQKSRLEMFK